MNDINRRALIKLLGFFAIGSSLAACQTSQKVTAKKAKVVVVGGGFAGATCARYLNQLNAGVQVTLIEAQSFYTACPLSNLVVSGDREIVQQQFNYRRVSATGVDVVTDFVTQVDPIGNKVVTEGGSAFGYDKLVVAPGIDIRWNLIEGYDIAAAKTMPHAWKAGAQTLILRDQLRAMPDGGLVVMAVPQSPYRCPPGPYERASLIAHYLKQHKPKSKLLVLDSKDSFSKMPLFRQAWQSLYGDMLEWRGFSDGAAVSRVEANTNRLFTDFDEIKADVANVIPPQQAGKVAQIAGLTDATGWCPIDPTTFESKLLKGIHVIGDAAIANAMPKSAFAANAQAKLCALQVSNLINGLEPVSTKLINTCYSLIDPSYGISVSDVFEPGETSWAKIKGAGGTSR